MRAFSQINVLLAAYGGALLVVGVFVLLSTMGHFKSMPLEQRALSAAPLGCGAALVLLALLAVHVARAARACLAALYAGGMLVLLVAEVAVLGWLAARGGFDDMELNAHTPTLVWVLLGLVSLLGVLQLAALALAAARALRARSDRATSGTAWKPML